MLAELQAHGVEQGDLFAPTSDRRDRLMAALDSVNGRFRNTLRVGNVGGWKAWHMAQDARTPCYTTDWGDLPIVRLGALTLSPLRCAASSVPAATRRSPSSLCLDNY
jgi:Domain of unknown function (DUF4113)